MLELQQKNYNCFIVQVTPAEEAGGNGMRDKIKELGIITTRFYTVNPNPPSPISLLCKVGLVRRHRQKYT